MKILVVGSGAREHALLWKLRQSPLVTGLFCAPGNAGTASLAANLPVASDNIAGLAAAASEHNIDLTVVGPEVPLMLGIVDEFERRGLMIFGPRKAAAEIEGSKLFAKQFMQRHGIPTAAYRSFTQEEFDQAVAYVRTINGKIVIKADGLAAGKGVIIAESATEAEAALASILRDGAFGTSGNSVVIEEFLEGEEASILAICDGDHFVTLPASQDHKRALDGDLGKNTGGMGAYAPVPSVTDSVLESVKSTILYPTIHGLATEGRAYRGCLYAGIILTAAGPKVIEFNCRFGDPETEVVLPLLDEDLAELLLRSASGTLETRDARRNGNCAVTVVMASGGYPDSSQTGKPVAGLPEAAALPDTVVFHAGTRFSGDAVVTAGGRVLAVTAFGPENDLRGTVAKAYHAVDAISFQGAHFRTDIARKAVNS